MKWGYDIVVERGVPTVKLNALAAGPYGGSAAFKRVLDQEMASSLQDPGHVGILTGPSGS